MQPLEVGSSCRAWFWEAAQKGLELQPRTHRLRYRKYLEPTLDSCRVSGLLLTLRMPRLSEFSPRTCEARTVVRSASLASSAVRTKAVLSNQTADIPEHVDVRHSGGCTGVVGAPEEPRGGTSVTST